MSYEAGVRSDLRTNRGAFRGTDGGARPAHFANRLDMIGRAYEPRAMAGAAQRGGGVALLAVAACSWSCR